MKQLSEGSTAHKFGSELLEDLSFIKKHKRYPFRRMTLMPLVASAILLLLFVAFIGHTLPLANSTYTHSGPYIVFTLMIVPAVIACKRYADTIRFFTLKTPFFLSENRKILHQFLQHHKFAFFNHPEAPEIFMILSRNVSAIGEEREVAVFIADDQQILINSHFAASRKKFNLMTGPTHQAQLIKMLRHWLKTYSQSGENIMLKRYGR